jgi:hypothetical protein
MSWLNTCASRKARHICIIQYMHMYICIYVCMCIHKKHVNGKSAHVELRPGGTNSLWLLFKPPLTLPAWATGGRSEWLLLRCMLPTTPTAPAPAVAAPAGAGAGTASRGGREEAEGAAAASAIPRDVNRMELNQV